MRLSTPPRLSASANSWQASRKRLDPARSVAAESGWGLGQNWYLTGNFKLVANYTRTSFDAALGAAPREDEKAFFTRAQFSF